MALDDDVVIMNMVVIVTVVVFVVVPRLHQVTITTTRGGGSSSSSNRKMHQSLLQNGLCRNLIHSQILIFILFGLEAFNDNSQTIHDFFHAQQSRDFATIDFQDCGGRFSTAAVALVPFHRPVFGVELVGEDGYEWTSSPHRRC